MTDESKELIKKDLITILQINARLHYDNQEEVKRIRNLVLQKDMLKTSWGNRYIKRLEQVIDGTTSDKCFLCNCSLDNETIICNNCLNKFTKAKNEKAGQEIPQTVVKSDSKKEQSEEKGNKRKQKFSSKTKIILAAIIALIMLGALLDKDSSSTNTREPVANGNEAYKTVQEFYSLDDFYISLNETANVPKAIFDGKVGKPVEQNAFMGEEQIGVYCYGLTSKDGNLSGQVWVSDNGGVVQLGLEGDGSFYLLK